LNEQRQDKRAQRRRDTLGRALGQGELLTSIAIALALAFAGGYIARYLRLPPILGYMAAGVVISPFTPGYDGDLDSLRAVADIGIIFLMFGIGLSFDISDLQRVRNVAIPGAVGLMALVAGAGIGIGLMFDLRWQEGLVLGIAMGIASSTVISRGLMDHGLVDSVPGRIAVGWSIVEDIGTVLILALLPALAGQGGNPWAEGAEALLKAAAFVGIMLIVGTRLIPIALRTVAAAGSRELFILGVVSFALGIATSAELFGVSIALGAFIAGVVISETEMGHQATADVLPLREAFAVLFFVSVGMLLDPRDLLDNLDLFLVVVAMVVVGKALLVLLIFAPFPFPGRSALLVAASIAQIGEFSFLVAQAGIDLEILSDRTYNVILGSAVVSIGLNPLLYRLAPHGERALSNTGPLWRYMDRQGPVPVAGAIQPNHVVVVGYGRVGELTGHALQSLGIPYVIVESKLERARRLTAAGFNVVWGDAATRPVLEAASLDRASLVVMAFPDENSTIMAVRNIREFAPAVPIVARARVREELEILQGMGVAEVVVPEYEGGLELMALALQQLGYAEADAESYRLVMRDVHYGIEPHE
jgi:monovalent cation:H+ antiporter-2, CPA2 family